ncbi:hypothetical protein [Streptomyces microflavus]|uniref:hypothetical protein n=1 Tax=Streptomyces microflavus TaxID=1919 RepID=UPI0036C54CF1
MSKKSNPSDDMLVQAGFNPNEVAYMFTPQFTRDDIVAALFESTYSDPRTLDLRLKLPASMAADVSTGVLVEKFKPIFIYEADGRPCTDRPDWYIEGRLRTRTTLGAPRTYVRIFMLDKSDAWVQRISTAHTRRREILIEEAYA